MSAVRHAGRVAAGLLPAAALARLGAPALVSVVILAVLALGAACWVIASGDRSDRVTRMIYARHGDARSLAPRSPPEADTGRRKPLRRRAIGRWRAETRRSHRTMTLTRGNGPICPITRRSMV